MSGIVEAVSLAAKLSEEQNRRVLIEDPCLDHVQAAFSHHRYELVPLPVDSSGPDTACLPRAPLSHLLYTVPSHQFPLGAILPIRRRLELVAYARSNGLWILEDDYDCEYRYEGIPIQPLQILAPERVIYFGTFSKVFYPALRLAFLVLPVALCEEAVATKSALCQFSPILEQLALTEWIREGMLERHIHGMKKIYRRERQLLMDAVHAAFGDSVSVKGANAGLHMLLEFRARQLTPAAITSLREHGVDVDWVEDYALLKHRNEHRLVIGYGSLSDTEIRAGVTPTANWLGQIERVR